MNNLFVFLVPALIFCPFLIFNSAYADTYPPLELSKNNTTATFNDFKKIYFYPGQNASVLNWNDADIRILDEKVQARQPVLNLKNYIVAIMRTNPSIQKNLLSIYSKYLDNKDKVISHPDETNIRYNKLLKGEHGIEYFSLDKIKSNAASLSTQGIEIISYDLEKGSSPLSDLRNPVESVKLASHIVHNNKMKLMLSPSRSLTSSFAAQFAKLTDLYNIQAQSLQREPDLYKNFVAQIVKQLHSANPSISISAQVSTARGSLDSMKKSISSVSGIVEGATTWYSIDNAGLIKLQRFIKWFNGKYE